MIWLPHFYGGMAATGAAAPVTFSLDWVSQESTTVDATTYTTAALSIGTADANRIILVGTSARFAGGTASVASMTIGGIAATQVASAAASIAGVLVVDFWYAAVPTGTTGVVAVTYGSSMVRAKVEVYRIISATTTPSTAGTPQSNAAGNALSHAVTVPSGGAAASMYFHQLPGNANDITWSNATKDDTTIQLEALATTGSAKATATATIGASITAAGNSGVGLSTVPWSP